MSLTAPLFLLNTMDEDENRSPWFERFEFIQPLGSGGMGEVYLVEDKSNANQLCVIKKIFNNKKGDLQAQAEMLRMGQREAEFLSKLNHRGIVKFLEDYYAAEENGYYVVMEYIPGSNLEEVMQKEGPIDSETVVRIGLQCCDVLEYLHAADPPIIYRDLKPSNLMLRPDGLVVFIDFGIARDKPKDGPATRVVTSGYSPPEQYFGKPEPRGDLYSLGATMHHLLTAVRPKPLTPCHPMKLNEKVIPELDALIFHLTAQEKDERPPSARAVQFELFKIYKKIHPEFEIPALDLDQDLEMGEKILKQEAQQSMKESRQNMKQSAGHKSTAKKKESDTTGSDSDGLVNKVRNWFGNLGKRSD